MRPNQGMEPCQKHLRAQGERQSYTLLAREGMGTPGCVNKRANKRRSHGVCQGIGLIRDSYFS